MTKLQRQILFVISCALIGFGLFFGISSTSIEDKASALATTTSGTLDCGSSWFPSYADAQEQAFRMPPDAARRQCEDSHGATGIIGIVLVGLGAGTALGLGFTRIQPQQEPTV